LQVKQYISFSEELGQKGISDSPWGAGAGEVETAGTERRLARPGAVSGQYRPAQCSGAADARRRELPGRAEPPRDGNEEEEEARRRGPDEAAGTRVLGLPQRWRRRRPEVRSSATRSMA
jgi:hypothetical protein